MKLKDEWEEKIEPKGWIRKGTIFKIGDKRVILSVQASYTHHSTPQISGLPLENYSEVEIAIINDKYRKGYSEPYFYLPSEIGIQGYDNYFSFGKIGPYVPLRVVEKLADKLGKKGTIVKESEE